MPACGIMFHHFSGRGHPDGQGAMSADDLAWMIQSVGPQRILPAREWYRRAMLGSLRPTDLCLTFDDNLRCQYDVAVPVLRSFGLTAFFFVYSSVLEGTAEPLEIYRYYRTTCFRSIDGFYEAFFSAVAHGDGGEALAAALERFEPAGYLRDFPFYTEADRRFRYVRDELLGQQRYQAIMDGMIRQGGHDVQGWKHRLWMNDACLQELHAEGHVIGLHSHTHPTRLERMSGQEQCQEYARNHAHLLRVLRESPLTMSHPCNSYNADTLKVLYDLGIHLGFRANMAKSACSQLELPREDHANILKRMRGGRGAHGMESAGLGSRPERTGLREVA